MKQVLTLSGNIVEERHRLVFHSVEILDKRWIIPKLMLFCFRSGVLSKEILPILYIAFRRPILAA